MQDTRGPGLQSDQDHLRPYVLYAVSNVSIKLPKMQKRCLE